MSLEQKHVEVRTSRLLLRPLVSEDAPGVLLLRSDPEVMKYTSHLPLKNVSQAEELMQTWKEAGRYSFVVELLTYEDQECGIEKDHLAAKREFVGSIGIVRCPEIGYCFRRKFWGKGYATEAMKAFLEIAWAHLSQPGGFDYVTAQVDTENSGSNRLLEKMGFKKQETTVDDFYSPLLNSDRNGFLWKLDRPIEQVK